MGEIIPARKCRASLALLLLLCAASGALAQTVNLRSIGTAPNRSTGGGDGTVAATNGSTLVTGTGTSWVTWNRGRGDVITINAVNYMVRRVDSETQLQLATPFTGTTGSGKSYTIARQFTTLAAWETCISGGACAYFPVGSGNLVTDNRTEIGIAYKDSLFTLTSSLTIQGSTTDATHTILLTADPGNRHNGVAGAGVVVNNNGGNEIDVRDSNVTVEWLELVGASGANVSPIQVNSTIGDISTNVLLQNLLVHSFNDPINDISGIDLAGDNTVPRGLTIRNCMIWDGDHYGIEGDSALDTLIIENVSIDGMLTNGIYAAQTAVTVRNTIVTGSGSADFAAGSGSLAGSNNTSSDGSASFGASAQTGVSAASVFVTPGSNLHLKAGANVAVNTALNLGGSFWNDIDGQSRLGLTWDRGADERDAVTAVELVSFTAHAADGEVLLRWETGAEVDNLGFRLYRARSPDGPFESLTTDLIPGLGSSPSGARYQYPDEGLENGVTYYYELEDIDTGGRATRHGSVAATPEAGRAESEPAVILYGDPAANETRVVESGRDYIVVELRTEGFRALPQGDGTVRIEAAGFEETEGLPIRRASVDALAGRSVKLVSFQASDVEAFRALVPQSGGRPEAEAGWDGTVRARRGVASRERPPKPQVEIVSVGFQGDSKKALVELRPFGWDGEGHLVLARRLRFTLSFRGRDRRERDGTRGRRYQESRSHRRRAVFARLATRERGLYALRPEDVGLRGTVSAASLKLIRLGESRPFFVEPDPARFGPGSTLFFLSEGGAVNPYGREAVFELQVDSSGDVMEEVSLPPSGKSAGFYWETLAREENRFYQAALVEAPEPWLWESLFAPQSKRFTFTLDEMGDAPEDATLRVWLQGASDFPAALDHHVRVSVNEVFLTEASWDGKSPQLLEAVVPLSALHNGENSLELENLGDGGASYSMVFLDRFEIRYPRRIVLKEGTLEGVFGEGGVVESEASIVLDVTGAPTRVRGEESATGGVRFQAVAGRSYVLVNGAGVLRPEVRRATAERLKSRFHAADYLVVGPDAFLDAARPLLQRRRNQGLAVKAVPIEDVYSEFGFGEARPEALFEFLSFAYHQWTTPPRYVLLLGDGSYDFKDYLGTGAPNPVPPLLVKTSYLWTASDPAYASVNGDDALPDLAIGRLPASNLEEVERLVGKILSYEAGAPGEEALAVLVADNSDDAGDFEADAESLASGVLSSASLRTIFLGRLGIEAAREQILDSFDRGASTLSYVGHGGIHLWASENLFDRESVALLSSQSRQPIVLTMNCLNGYFHFPFFNALAEELLKADGRGAIAAFSPTGLSLNEPAHQLHQALLRELLSKRHQRLGDAVLAAQSAYADSGAYPELLRIYHLLGDPAMTLRR